MKKTPPKPTHDTIAKNLGVSRSYASRLIREGMPDNDTEAAKRWIEKRAAETGATTSSSTLADQRREKLRLECCLLALRLQRESDNVQYLPAASVTDCVRTFSRLALIAMRYRAEEHAEALAATTTPNQAVKITRNLLLESWLTGICGMLGQLQLDGRLVAAVKTLVREEFAGIDDDQVERWIEAVNGKVAA